MTNAAFKKQVFHDPDINEDISLANEGQKVIYQLRRAYKLGSLAVTENLPADLQKILNTPLVLNQKISDFTTEDRAFLHDVITKIEQGKIQLYTPSTLLNEPVYQSLSLQGKAKADFDILNLLNKIREIKRLWDAGEKDTYQILNLVRGLRLIKERIESVSGDVFII